MEIALNKMRGKKGFVNTKGSTSKKTPLSNCPTLRKKQTESKIRHAAVRFPNSRFSFANIKSPTRPPTIRKTKSLAHPSSSVFLPPEVRETNKRGASHIEMIISFILFIVFVLFLLVYIQPYGSGPLTDSVLLALHDGFEEETDGEVSIVFLKVGGVDVPDKSVCRPEDEERNMISRKVTSAEGDENPLYDYYYLSISEDFVGEDIRNCADGAYALGSINKKIVTSRKKIEELKVKYDEDYENLREEMGISASIDFGITIVGGDVMEKHIPEEVAIFTRVYNHEILETNGTIVNKEVLIKIWQ